MIKCKLYTVYWLGQANPDQTKPHQARLGQAIDIPKYLTIKIVYLLACVSVCVSERRFMECPVLWIPEKSTANILSQMKMEMK